VSKFIGGIVDSYAPGSGALIDSIGDTVNGIIPGAEHPIVHGLMKNGYKNHLANVLRPITSRTRRSDSVVHITRKQNYY